MVPREHAHTHATAMSNWHSKDGEGAMTKRRQIMMTKTMSQDDTDTNNEGTDDNNNNSGDQGMNTNNEDHKMMIGMEMEMYNNNHTTKMVAVAHDEGDDEHRTEQKVQVMDTVPYDEECKKGPK